MRRVDEYRSWARSLASRNALVSAEKLASDAGTLVASQREVAGSPASDGFVTGFFIVKAASYEQAVALARESPHLKFAGVVEIRAIQH